MRLAETVRGRWVIALASVAAAGTLIALASRCERTTRTRPAEVTHRCRERVVHAPPPAVVAPAREITGADYQTALLRGRAGYEACIAHQPSGVTYNIRMPIDPAGYVTSVEVRGESADVTKINLRVVKCLEIVSSHLVFPASGAPTAVSTSIVTK